jgi:trimethyllysine dioxygenase
MNAHQTETAEDSDVSLIAAELVGGQIHVHWKSKVPPAEFSPFWLRDHCHAKHSLNADTLQREVDTFSIPMDITPAKIQIEDGGRTLNIVWANDRGVSTFPAAFLWNIAQDKGRTRAPHRQLWGRDLMAKDLPGMDHEEIMGSEAGLLRWLSLVEEFGFALSVGAEASMAGTEALVKRVGYVRETIFGGMWEFSANMAFSDTAYTSVAIGPHTDGTYSNDPPGFQMFQCLEFDGSGGESTLVDGFSVAETIRKMDPQSFRLLSEIKVPAHYLGDGVHLRAEHPIIGLDDNGDLRQIAYNNYDRAPFQLTPARTTDFYRALALFHRLINDPDFEISMRLTPGTVLFFDNWRTLHGRRAFNGHRHMCGAYVNMEDFQSKLRVLRRAGSAKL